MPYAHLRSARNHILPIFSAVELNSDCFIKTGWTDENLTLIMCRFPAEVQESTSKPFRSQHSKALQNFLKSCWQQWVYTCPRCHNSQKWIRSQHVNFEASLPRENVVNDIDISWHMAIQRWMHLLLLLKCWCFYKSKIMNYWICKRPNLDYQQQWKTSNRLLDCAERITAMLAAGTQRIEGITTQAITAHPKEITLTK